LGTQLYPPGTSIDPVITVRNSQCEVVQTNSIRVTDLEPEAPLPQEPILVPIPSIEIPPLDVISCEIPEIDISIPPIVLPPIDIDFPSIDISIPGFSVSIPAVISIVPPIPNVISISPPIPTVISIDVDLPSVISIVPAIPTTISIIHDIPSIITIVGDPIPAVISFGPVDIPSIITVDCTDCSLPELIIVDCSDCSIPDTIIVDCSDCSLPDTIIVDCSDCSLPETIFVDCSDCSIPDTIFVDCSDCSIPDVSVDWAPIPTISVEWGPTPTITCSVTCTCNCCSSTPAPFAPTMRKLIEDGYYDFDDEILSATAASVGMQYETDGFPSLITVEPPKIDAIQVEHTLPTKITLESPVIPDIIDIRGAENIPSELNLIVPTEMPAISIDATALPESIPIDWGDVPRDIRILPTYLPSTISLEHDVPSVISIEGMINTISIEGFPDYLPIKLENPEDLVLRIEPAEVKITLDVDKLLTDKEGGQYCFALTPCQP